MKSKILASDCFLFVVPNKIKQVEQLLKDEPGSLTFYGQPVSQVEEFYVHIGVPQATRNQSKVIVDYRISKGQDMTYLLQNSTRNTLSGISPLSNRKMFSSYHQPSFIYGTDTMTINETDLERLEIKYRDVLRHMLSLPKYTKASLIYLSLGVLPARAQRDLEILGLFGQLALCSDDSQNIRKVIQNSLTFYDVNFTGWSGLVRKTCLRYGLPDPLQILLYPWRPDRWRQHCKEKIISFWENYLKENLSTSQQAALVDVDNLSLSKPLQLWEEAGLESQDVLKTTIVSWMLLGVYQTKDELKDMLVMGT